jgi:hypothetical protein
MDRATGHQGCRRLGRCVWLVAAIVLAMDSLPAALYASDDNTACRKDPRVVAACFTVHGRLSNWNGNPTERIWIIGTKRMLGLREDTSLPKALEDKLGNFDDQVYGDFDFGPFTAEKAGVMQVGCVAGVSNYQIRKRSS